MDDNKFWLRMTKLVMGGMMLGILALGTCTAYESKLIKDMVKDGADPIMARCAISPQVTTVCVLSKITTGEN